MPMFRRWEITAAVKPDGMRKALFKSFRVEGRDELPPCDEKTQFRNPIVDGMAPDPSVTRKGDDYYLANSSFAYFPGIPVWHSTDLVKWDFCGYIQSRKSQLDMKPGLDVSQGVAMKTGMLLSLAPVLAAAIRPLAGRRSVPPKMTRMGDFARRTNRV